MPTTQECRLMKVERGFIRPSSAFSLRRSAIRYYRKSTKRPAVGDVVYGEICRMGEHSTLENASGRVHMVQDGTRAVFVFGNRYAPDYFEGVVPSKFTGEVDLLARSGLLGVVKTKNTVRKDPTRVKILGYVCDASGKVVNTREYRLAQPKSRTKKFPRAKLVLVCGTSMNSGKSMAAVACCRALSSTGQRVRASKVTGTASLKDILHMNDGGARPFADFTYLGYPSTYMLSQHDVLGIFDTLDLKYANNPKNYWVVEFADGINQRETAMLLASPEVRNRIHRFVFCANDAFGAVGGLGLLKERFGIEPDMISGLCASSPLYVRELKEFTDVPVFNSMSVAPKKLAALLNANGKRLKT